MYNVFFLILPYFGFLFSICFIGLYDSTCSAKVPKVALMMTSRAAKRLVHGDFMVV